MLNGIAHLVQGTALISSTVGAVKGPTASTRDELLQTTKTLPPAAADFCKRIKAVERIVRRFGTRTAS